MVTSNMRGRSYVCTVDYLLSRTMPIPECGCFIWLGSTTTSGYPTCTYKQKCRRVTRLIKELELGKELKQDEVVMHTCDIPSCVNPKHLRVGTSSENTIDCYNKGRRIAIRGSKNGASKLTSQDVLEIRDLARVMNSVEMANIYGVSARQIRWITQRGRWKHI